MVLELSEWKWDIPTIDRQPDPELWAVMSMKMLGEKMRIAARNAKRQPDQPETI